MNAHFYTISICRFWYVCYCYPPVVIMLQVCDYAWLCVTNYHRLIVLLANFETLMCFAYNIKVWESLEWQNYYHCEKKKHLSYSYHIFELSQLHQFDQEMLPNRFSWKSFFFGYISSYSLPSEHLFGYILGISTTSMQTRNSPEADM